jgi:hypothetical protein
MVFLSGYGTIVKLRLTPLPGEQKTREPGAFSIWSSLVARPYAWRTETLAAMIGVDDGWQTIE